jgi:FlaG/FlaF family flagellin (archaellin)
MNTQKLLTLIIASVTLSTTVPAQEATPNAAASATPPVMAASPVFVATNAVVTAPLVVTNDYLVLTGDQAELTVGCKAVFNFTVTNAGKYEIATVINAPDESSNSFFVNIDAAPQDPDMIWDVEVTHGFEPRLANWRGGGTDSADEFAPKVFTLTAGAHQLIIVGREPGAELKSWYLKPAPVTAPAPTSP